MPGPPLPGPDDIRADWIPWQPPAPPLRPDELQRGLSTRPPVSDEHGYDSSALAGALSQWSALPALSHFLTAAMRCRELARRIKAPTTFRAPPRVTLTDGRRAAWLGELVSKDISLRRLSRAVPHGLVGRALLDECMLSGVPTGRAVWFARCIGANELRGLRRVGKHTQEWIDMWSRDVCAWFDSIAALGGNGNLEWPRNIAYATKLVFALMSERLLSIPIVTEWLLSNIEEPCVLHLLHVLWQFVPPIQLLTVGVNVESVVSRLAADRNIPTSLFVQPELWPNLGPVLERVNLRRWTEVSARIVLFTPPATDKELTPPQWITALRIGRVLDDFIVPYRFAELYSSIQGASRGTPPSVLVSTVLLWAVRRGDPSSVQLCVALCRRFQRAGVTVSEHLIAFLMGPNAMSTPTLYDLISECWRTRLFTVDAYLYRLIASGLLYTSSASTSRAATRQRAILRNLPLCTLPLRTQSQIFMLLRERPPPPDAVNEVTAIAREILGGNLSHASKALSIVATITKNERMLVSREMVISYNRIIDSGCELGIERLEPFIEILDEACGGSIGPLFSFLSATLKKAKSTAVAVFAMRHVHRRLLTLVCAGLTDTLVARFLERVRAGVGGTDLARVARPLQLIVHSPVLLMELNRLLNGDGVPTPTTAGAPTPQEIGAFETTLDAAIKGTVFDLSVLLELKEDKAHTSQLLDGVLGWIRTHAQDRRSVLQLVTYGIVALADIDAAMSDDALMAFLLLVPANQLGLAYEEISYLEAVRRDFFASASVSRLLEILVEASRDIERPAIARIALAYADLYIDRIVRPSLEDRHLLGQLRKFSTSSRSISELLERCNPFNLLYYQGMVLVALAGLDRHQAVMQIVDAARANPGKAAEVLRSLLRYISDELRSAVLQHAVSTFLAADMPTEAADADLAVVSALLESNILPQISPDEFKRCVDSILAAVVSHKVPSQRILPCITCVIRLAVTVRDLAPLVLGTLRHLQTLDFSDESYKTSTFLEDAIQILDRPSISHRTDTSEIFKLYSRSQDAYRNINVESFDLIQDAAAHPGVNDTPIDLSRFEMYCMTTNKGPTA